MTERRGPALECYPGSGFFSGLISLNQHIAMESPDRVCAGTFGTIRLETQTPANSAVDGSSTYTCTGIGKDQVKFAFFASCGWRVLRVPLANEQEGKDLNNVR